jgi:hypothetical protein
MKRPPKIGSIVFDVRTNKRLGMMIGGGDHMAIVLMGDGTRLRIWKCFIRSVYQGGLGRCALHGP